MTAAAPALPAHTPTSRAYRVVELYARYRPREVGKVWKLADTERQCELLPSEYSTEALAKQGALLQAAFDIDDLYAGRIQ